MLSFHSLHSLYAELALLAIGLLVFAYRFVGSNEWLKTHGLVLVAYYAVGGLVYDELEGWKLLDTAYFLTVTITTVGYGDICPETPEGKMFTVFYAVVGIVFVFAALSPLVDALMFVKDLLLKPITPKEPTAEDCDDGSFDIDDLRKGGNWTFKYCAALAGPGLIFVLGLMIGFFVMGYDLVDGVYWSMITMTTIGYGDLSASTGIQQVGLGPCARRDLRRISARSPPPARATRLHLPPSPPLGSHARPAAPHRRADRADDLSADGRRGARRCARRRPGHRHGQDAVRDGLCGAGGQAAARRGGRREPQPGRDADRGGVSHLDPQGERHRR